MLLDGGVALELARLGYQPQGPLRDAAVARDAPDLLASAYRAMVSAGADVVTAYTGRSTVRALARGGVAMRAAALTHRAVDLALEAAASAAGGRSVAVAAVLSSEPSVPRALVRAPSSTPSPSVPSASSAPRRLSCVGPSTRIARAPAAVITVAARSSGVPSRRCARSRSAMVVHTAGARAILVEGPTQESRLGALDALGTLGLGVLLGARTSARGIEGSDESAAAPEEIDRAAAELAASIERGARIVGGTGRVTTAQVSALSSLLRARAAA